ncbi:MAG: ATP-binding protein [Gammaproteobacteria bacterium]
MDSYIPDASMDETMSLGRFGLRRKPFSATDVDSYFSNSCYALAFERLLKGLESATGLLTLTGAPGLGKTLLLRKLMRDNAERYQFIFFPNGRLSFDELLGLVCERLGIAQRGHDRLRKLKAIGEYVASVRQRRSSLILLIDDAHELPHDSLNHLLTLLRIGFKQRHSLQIILSGKPGLREHLVRHSPLHPGVAKAVHAQLVRLTDGEVKAYIHHHLRIAGDPEGLFPATVIERITRHAQGNPRSINLLCDRALLIAQRFEQTEVTVELLDAAAAEVLTAFPAHDARSSATADEQALPAYIGEHGAMANASENERAIMERASVRVPAKGSQRTIAWKGRERRRGADRRGGGERRHRAIHRSGVSDVARVRLWSILLGALLALLLMGLWAGYDGWLF